MNEYLIGLIIGLAFTAVALAIAFTRRGKASDFDQPTARMLEFTSPHDAAETERRLLDVPQQSKYKIDDQDGPMLVLSSKPTLFSWGFFFPTFLVAQSDGTTQVKIGIKSKVFQMGPIVTKAHQECRDAVERIVVG